MRLPGKIALVILFSNGILTAFTQEKKQLGQDVHSLFADLPIPDASDNSILNKNESVTEKIRRNLFVKATSNKTSAYLGEPVLITYRLYTALKSRSRISAKPPLTDFNVLELDASNDSVQQKMIAGRNYRVFTIWQAQLSSFQSGNLSVDPIWVDNTIDYTAKDKNEYHYSGAVKSNPLHLTILPLPVNGKPEGFPGVVGKFNILASIDKRENVAGENNNLHIEISGSGNFDNISLPVIIWPLGADHFMVRETLLTGKNEFPPNGKKTFDIPFVSNLKGSYVLPPLTLSYFDPVLKMYQKVSSHPISMNISSAPLKQTQENPGSGIAGRTDHYVGEMVWILFGSIAAGAVLTVFSLKRKQALRKVREQESVKLAELAAAELETPSTDFGQEMKGIAEAEDNEQYIVQVKSLLIRLLQEKFVTDFAAEEDLLGLLSDNTHDKGLVDEIREVFSRCTRMLYSPSGQADFRASITASVTGIVSKINLIRNS